MSGVGEDFATFGDGIITVERALIPGFDLLETAAKNLGSGIETAFSTAKTAVDFFLPGLTVLRTAIAGLATTTEFLSGNYKSMADASCGRSTQRCSSKAMR